MSGIFLWGGLACIIALPVLGATGVFSVVGAILMIIGVILLILGR